MSGSLVLPELINNAEGETEQNANSGDRNVSLGASVLLFPRRFFLIVFVIVKIREINNFYPNSLQLKNNGCENM